MAGIVIGSKHLSGLLLCLIFLYFFILSTGNTHCLPAFFPNDFFTVGLVCLCMSVFLVLLDSHFKKCKHIGCVNVLMFRNKSQTFEHLNIFTLLAYSL